MLNIVFIIKQKEYIIFIGLAVLVLLVVMILFFPFRYAKVNVELTLFDRDRTKIVEMIKNGDLQKKYSGNIDLPSGYRRLSSDGEVHVYRNDEEGQVIGFWVFREMLSSYTHLMYSSGGEDLITEKESRIIIFNQKL